LRDLRVDGKIILIVLKLISEKWSVKVWTGLIWLRVVPSGKFSEHVNEPSGSIKALNILDL